MFNFKSKVKEAILKVGFADGERLHYTCECGLESSVKTDLVTIDNQSEAYFFNDPVVCEKCKKMQKRISYKINDTNYLENSSEMTKKKFYDNIDKKIAESGYTEKIKAVGMDGKNSNCIPKCPTCGSENINKIGAINKVGSVVTFGIFSVGHISKIFKCKNCGYKW